MLALVGSAVVLTASHLVLHTGFALDDWFPLAHARFGGMWQAGDIQAGPRPGQWVIYALTFGVFGRHPVPYVLVLSVVTAMISIAFFALLARFVRDGTAFAVSLLWLFLPNHMTMEVWASAVNINIAVLAMLVAFNIGLRRRRTIPWTVLSAVLLGFAAVSYDATVPAIVIGILLLPVLKARKIDKEWIIISGFILAVCAAWMLGHWNENKQSAWNPGALPQMVPAHFGWGIVPEGPLGMALTVIVLIISVVAFERVLVPRRRSGVGSAEWLVVVGWVVILISLVPFLLYVYGPVGAGDRVNCVSALGGAMTLVGVFQLTWRLRREAAVIGAVAVLFAAASVRIDRTRTWSTAFGDADRILAATHRRVPSPEGMIVFGPSPIQRSNIAAFLDQSNVDSAVRVEYDDPGVRAGMAFSRRAFESAPRDHRIDIRPLSKLRPDVDLSID